ncbi:MAG: hypothetical protein AAB561_00720 [Patescibacteria group bacterium]
MEGENKREMQEDPLRQAAINELHELDLSAEPNISDNEFEAFQSLVGHMKEREADNGRGHLINVNPRFLGKFDALMYRWALSVQLGTEEFGRFIKEKDSIESILRKAKNSPQNESRSAFYEFLTNLIELPSEKRKP